MARCKACNKDMKSHNGDEYWRIVRGRKGGRRVLEDLCKACRRHIYEFDKKMQWKEYESALDFLTQHDDILSVKDTRHLEGIRPPCGNPDEL